MPNISGPTAPLAVIAALVLSGIVAGAPIARAATADNCAATPNAAAPAGQHWYYHFDRATHQKCWYLHATVALAHHAAADTAAAATESAGGDAPPRPAASAPASAMPLPESNGDSAPPAAPSTANPDGAQPPRVTVLTVKTVPEPFVDTTARPQQRAAEITDSPPAPQALAEQATTTDGKPAEDAAPAPAPAAPEIVDHDQAPTIGTASAAARKRSGEMFLLLALALGIAAGIVAIIGKIVGPYRTPRFADHPDAAWMRYRSSQQRFDDEAAYDDVAYDEEDVPFLDPQPEHGLADPRDDLIDRSPPAVSEFPARSREAAPGEPPSVKDIELALRILKQARQSGVA